MKIPAMSHDKGNRMMMQKRKTGINWNGSQYLRLAELDEVLVGGPRWQASDVQVGLTQLLRPSLAAAVGAGAGRSHGMRGWSIGLLGKEGRENT